MMTTYIFLGEMKNFRCREKKGKEKVEKIKKYGD